MLSQEEMTKINLFTVVDEKLLHEYTKKKCWICGSTFKVAAHHHRKRSKQRLDVPENLTELCQWCHSAFEAGLSNFKKHIEKIAPELVASQLYNTLKYPKMDLIEIYKKYNKE